MSKRDFTVVGFWKQSGRIFTHTLSATDVAEAIFKARIEEVDCSHSGTSIVAVFDGLSQELNSIVEGPVGEAEEIEEIRKELPSDDEDAVDVLLRATLAILNETSDLGSGSRVAILTHYIKHTRR